MSYTWYVYFGASALKRVKDVPVGVNQMLGFYQNIKNCNRNHYLTQGIVKLLVNFTRYPEIMKIEPNQKNVSSEDRTRNE